MEKEIKIRVSTIEKKTGQYGEYILIGNATASPLAPYQKIMCGKPELFTLFKEDSDYVLLVNETIKNGYPNAKVKTIIARDGVPLDAPSTNSSHSNSYSRSFNDPEKEKKIIKQSCIRYAAMIADTYFSHIYDDNYKSHPDIGLTEFARTVLDISDILYEHVNE